MTLTHITGRKNQVLMWREGENRIDAKATEVRARFATPGMDGIYLSKRDEAARYLADLAALPDGETPDLTQYPYLGMEAGATAETPQALAELWIYMNQQWQVAAAFIEGVRTAGKAQVRAARSNAAIDLTVLETIAQLDEIGPKPPTRPSKPTPIVQPVL